MQSKNLCEQILGVGLMAKSSKSFAFDGASLESTGRSDALADKFLFEPFFPLLLFGLD